MEKRQINVSNSVCVFLKLEMGLLQWTLKWGEGNSNSQVQYPNAAHLIALFVSLLKMMACCSLTMNAE